MAKVRQEAERLVIEIGRPAPIRWLVLLALASLAGLTGAMALGALAREPMASLGFALASAGLVALLIAAFRSRASVLRFDGERLTDDTGAELCRLDEIVQIDRGFVFLKPSTGFLVTLKSPKPFAWAPGLWWRFGRRIGVGGATSRAAGKAMAETISLEMARRSAG